MVPGAMVPGATVTETRSRACGGRPRRRSAEADQCATAAAGACSTIALNGDLVMGLSPRLMARRGVARTFQITAAFASMTVRENVQTACVGQAGLATRLAGRTDRRFTAEADSWLDKVGLLPQAHRPASELAYGDLKRLELAMALTGRPTLLLMDEPTAGMAPKERHALMDFTVAYARRNDIGLLFTEHDMDIVFAHADRVLVLSRGAVIAAGAPEAVRRDPEVRASYLGEGLVSGLGNVAS